jgi:hypothetical protein
VKFFKTTRAYRNAVLKENDHTSSSYANTVTLQDKTQDQAQRDEAQKSKNNNPSNKGDNLKTRDNTSKKRARKCACDEIHEFEECSYIVSSARKSD